MPLQNGIAHFSEPRFQFYVPDELIGPFFLKSSEILEVFKNKPQLAQKPYYGWSIYLPYNDNVIWQAVDRAGLASLSHLALEAFPAWREIADEKSSLTLSQRYEQARGYALIDTAVYLLHLLNIYASQRAVLKNLYYANDFVDALGLEFVRPAVTAISKIVSKSLGVGRLASAEIQARNLIAIIRLDNARLGERSVGPLGIEFERECARRLEGSDFQVQMTRTSGDFGADIIASKHGLSYAIQCKDYGKPVGLKGVQEVAAARTHYRTDFAVVCAPSNFTDAAIELAGSCKVILCNLDQLTRRLEDV